MPAEAIFAEINAYHPNIVKYAANKKVWITSPTTLMSLLTIIQSVLMGLERDKYTSVIHEELNKLGTEFGRYKERWDKDSKFVKFVNDFKGKTPDWERINMSLQQGDFVVDKISELYDKEGISR